MVLEARSNKVCQLVQGNVSQYQMYGGAADLRSVIFYDDRKSESGVSLILSAVYLRNFLSVISETYEGFLRLLNTKQSENVSLKTL